MLNEQGNAAVNFNSFQKLFEYLEYCPYCQDHNRKIGYFGISNSLLMVIDKYQWNNPYLDLDITFTINKKMHLGKVIIDSSKNSFSLDIKEFI